MKFVLNQTNIHLRPASHEDCDLLFKWRNLPEIINLSSSRRKVSHAEHKFWFQSVLENSNKLIFIIEEGGLPVGQIRFDINIDGEAEISIYLIPGQGGRGIGGFAISIGCDLLSDQNNVKKIVANIRSDNSHSISAFTKCGFKSMPNSSNLHQHITLVKNIIYHSKHE